MHSKQIPEEHIDGFFMVGHKSLGGGSYNRKLRGKAGYSHGSKIGSSRDIGTVAAAA